MMPSSLLDRTLRPLRRLLPAGRFRSVVAVDVGTSSVKAIHVRRDDGTLVLDGYRRVALPAHAADDEIEAACRQALELRLRGEPVAACLTSPQAAIRKVELPVMTADELRQALPWEARRHIANLADDSIVDAQILHAGSPGGPMEIVLVAFPREPYRRLERVWQALGVSPSFVDVGQLATLNAFLSASSAGPVGALDLGSDEASLAVFSSSDLILFRDLSVRIQRLDTLLLEGLKLNATDLETLKSGGKLARGPIPPNAVDEALADLVSELAEDVRSALVYFENRTGRALERIHLTGANAAFLERHGVADGLSALAGIPLERYNPFRSFRLGLVDQVGLKSASSDFCGAAGVASRFLSAS